MTTDPTSTPRPRDPDADAIGAVASRFDAAVRVAFGDRADAELADTEAVARLRSLVAALREAPLERPSNALRARAERLMTDSIGEAAHLPSSQRHPALVPSAVVAAWIEAARQVVMDLVRPDLAGGMQPSLAGFRGAAAPLRTFRAVAPAAEGAQELGNGSTIDAWLDLQVDPVAGGSRLRGQITCEHEEVPVMLHLVDPATKAVLASEPIGEDGTFVTSTDRSGVTLVIELDSGETALVVRDVVLRT